MLAQRQRLSKIRATVPLNAVVHDFLKPVSSVFESTRQNSGSKILKPIPRSYRRRTFEAALKPVVPFDHSDHAAKCGLRKELYEPWKERVSKPNPFNIALINHLREFLKDKRLIGVCQGFLVAKRLQQMNLGEMKKAGISVQPWEDSKILASVVEGTRMAALKPLMTSKVYLLCAETPDKLKDMVTFSKKLSWLSLIACVFEDKILSAQEAERIAKLPSLNAIPQELAGIISQPANALTQTLSSVVSELSQNLQAYEKQLSSDSV